MSFAPYFKTNLTHSTSFLFLRIIPKATHALSLVKYAYKHGGLRFSKTASYRNFLNVDISG
jgi:hypothetical protein